MIKRSIVNFSMIQTAIFATSVSVGAHIPSSNGMLMAIGFVWILAFLLTFIPSVFVSIAFAYAQERK